MLSIDGGAVAAANAIIQKGWNKSGNL